LKNSGMGGTRSRPRTVFYSVSAQWDNLGDIEIRDAALSWILASGSDVVAYSGGMPTSYLSAFRSDGLVRWEPSARRYQLALVKQVVRRTASIVFAPGPYVFRDRPGSLAKSVVNLVNVGLVRHTGGVALAAGRSLRGTGRVARLLMRKSVASFDLFTVRDSVSAEVVRCLIEAAPDLAFEHVGEPDRTSNPLAVLSLRSDRPIDVARVRELSERLQQRGLETVLVTQVKRDDEQHLRLGRATGLRVVSWNTQSHSEQLRRVRKAYESAEVVISNRLHALIFGMQYGAVPVAILDGESDKLSTTLDPWVTLNHTSPSLELVNDKAWTEFSLDETALRLSEQMVDTRATLAEVRVRFVDALRESGTR
jgi:hypothetical protein